jgi:hypothetical protein
MASSPVIPAPLPTGGKLMASSPVIAALMPSQG